MNEIPRIKMSSINITIGRNNIFRVYLTPKNNKKIKRTTISTTKEIKTARTLEITKVSLGKLRFFTKVSLLVIMLKVLVVEMAKKFQNTIPTKR